MNFKYLLVILIFMPFLSLKSQNNHDAPKQIIVKTNRITIKLDNLLEFNLDTNYLFWEDKSFICICGLCYLNNKNSYLNLCFDFGPKQKTFKESISSIIKNGRVRFDEKIIYPPIYKEIGGKGIFLQESILNIDNKSYHVFLSHINIDSEFTFKIKLTHDGNATDIRKKVYQMLISFKILRYNKNGNWTYYCG